MFQGLRLVGSQREKVVEMVAEWLKGWGMTEGRRWGSADIHIHKAPDTMTNLQREADRVMESGKKIKLD